MFEGLRKKLAQNVREEEEEIVFKPVEDEYEAVKAKEERPQAEQKSASISGNNIELKVVRPESIEEILTIADHLIAGCTVVLNLELLDKESITRMLDFLNGVTYTKGGEIKSVAQSTYIITPSGINVEK